MMDEPDFEAGRGRPSLLPLGAVLLGVLLLIGMVAGARYLADAINGSGGAASQIAPGTAVAFEVPPGSSAKEIGNALEVAGVVGSVEFQRRVSQRQVASELKAGSYALTTGMGPDAVIDLMLVGNVRPTIRFTVVEGLTIEEMLDSLAASTGLERASLVRALEDGSVSSPLLPGSPESVTDWEGLLFPDTYEIVADAAPARVLQLMADTMVRRVTSVDWSRLSQLGVNQYEAIVIASLIEEEVKIDEERPLVASVIYNRLEGSWPLQIDATVQYALDNHKAGLTLADLEVESPYNTYLHTGLPPTPIAGVRLTSLEAAANPADTPYFFYVLSSADGRHSFAATLDEFNRLKARARADGILPP